MAEHTQEQDALQAYFDWQVNTVMLAYDLHDPVDATVEGAGEKRRAEVEDEVRVFTLSVVPDVYKNDPSLDWGPDLMRTITHATIKRAAEIAG